MLVTSILNIFLVESGRARLLTWNGSDPTQFSQSASLDSKEELFSESCRISSCYVFPHIVFMRVCIVCQATYYQTTTIESDPNGLHLKAPCVIALSTEAVSQFTILNDSAAASDGTKMKFEGPGWSSFSMLWSLHQIFRKTIRAFGSSNLPGACIMLGKVCLRLTSGWQIWEVFATELGFFGNQFGQLHGWRQQYPVLESGASPVDYSNRGSAKLT